jgi:hypothetical protein
MRVFRLAVALAAAASLSACVPALLSALGGMAGSAPVPAQVNRAAAIARGPIDFALHAFDAALYALDFAMDAHKLQPGSATAKKIAATGREVLHWLGVADGAQVIGNSATYEEAFAKANPLLNDFRSLLPGATPAALVQARRDPLTWAEREAILTRLERGTPTI